MLIQVITILSSWNRFHFRTTNPTYLITRFGLLSEIMLFKQIITFDYLEKILFNFIIFQSLTLLVYFVLFQLSGLTSTLFYTVITELSWKVATSPISTESNILHQQNKQMEKVSHKVPLRSTTYHLRTSWPHLIPPSQ